LDGYDDDDIPVCIRYDSCRFLVNKQRVIKKNIMADAVLFKRLTLELQEIQGRLNCIKEYLTRLESGNSNAIVGVEPPATNNRVDAGAGDF
jgi:hypothetical protein